MQLLTLLSIAPGEVYEGITQVLSRVITSLYINQISVPVDRTKEDTRKRKVADSSALHCSGESVQGDKRAD